MKKLYTLALMALAVVSLQAKVYTLADLAAIEGSGVTFVDGDYIVNVDAALTEDVVLDDGGITVNKTDLIINEGNSLKIQDGERLFFGNKARITVNGDISAIGITSTILISATDDAVGSALGFRVYYDEASVAFKAVEIKYVGISFGSANGSLTIENCYFDSHNGKLSNNAVNFTASSKGNVVKNTTFYGCYGGCIATGATNPVGINISGCIFEGNGTSKRLLPAINICCGGDNDIYIEDNEIYGTGQETRAGGIALGNLLGVTVNNTCYVRRNLVKSNSYGITLTGAGKVYIEDNQIIDNYLIQGGNPNSGGSGINITNSNGTSWAFIKGNYIEGNFWGITNIGANEVNCGKTEDPNAEDYNPGLNVFVNNGNGDAEFAKCDLANNGTATLYAQGNTWSVDEQTEEQIETCIYHKNDNDALGVVIFMPPFDPNVGVTDIKVNAPADGVYYNLLGQPVANPSNGIYIINGKKVLVK